MLNLRFIDVQISYATPFNRHYRMPGLALIGLRCIHILTIILNKMRLELYQSSENDERGGRKGRRG